MSQFVVYPKIALNSALGQQVMAASMSVAIASDQTAVPVSFGSLPLPTGAATEATLSAMSAKLPAALGQLAMAASMSVVLASDQSAVNVAVTGTVPLPTGAATEATLAAMSAKLPATLGQKTMANSMAVVLASDQTVIPVSQSGTWNITNVSGTVSLPTGAATSALQTTISGQIPATLGAKVTAASLAVNIASDQTLLSKAAGKSSANAPARNDYTSVSVTTGAYVQLVASTTSACTEIEIFDSSGQTLVLALGAAASEVNQINIFPGGNGRIPLAIPASSRVSIKAVSATANVGEIDINFYA